MSNHAHASAFAPASIGNLGVGFDMLGLAIDGVGDRVAARRVRQAGVSIAEVRGIDGEAHPFLSTDAGQNTASIAAASLWDEAGVDGGVELIVYKGIPLQSGMGSSAASAVAAVVAVNALLPNPRPHAALLMHALQGEKYASGGLHADNVAPSLLGGLILCPQKLLPETITLSVPPGIGSVVLHPEIQVSTAESRRGLAGSYSMDQWLEQQGYLAAFVAACGQGDIALFGKSLRDVIIEPQRAGAVPCFESVRSAALRAGALGCSLSGSGPAIFAMCPVASAHDIAATMEQQCRAFGFECQTWVSDCDARGAFVEADSCE